MAIKTTSPKIKINKQTNQKNWPHTNTHTQLQGITKFCKVKLSQVENHWISGLVLYCWILRYIPRFSNLELQQNHSIEFMVLSVRHVNDLTEWFGFISLWGCGQDDSLWSIKGQDDILFVTQVVISRGSQVLPSLRQDAIVSYMLVPSQAA